MWNQHPEHTDLDFNQKICGEKGFLPQNFTSLSPTVDVTQNALQNTAPGGGGPPKTGVGRSAMGWEGISKNHSIFPLIELLGGLQPVDCHDLYITFPHSPYHVYYASAYHN